MVQVSTRAVVQLPDHVGIQLKDECQILPAEILLPLQLLLRHILKEFVDLLLNFFYVV